MSMGMAMMMIVIAMLVMVMIVMVMMAVIIMMMFAMLLRWTIMHRVTMRIAFGGVRMAVAGIGAAFGIERRLDLDHARAKPLHHRLDHMVAPDPQAFRHDLGRQMAVAEMPGDPNQVLRILSTNFEQRLRRRDDFDQPVIVEHQRVAAAQRNRVFQIEQELQPLRAGHRNRARRYRPAPPSSDARRGPWSRGS